MSLDIASYGGSLEGVLDQLRILVQQRHHRVSPGWRQEEDRSLRSGRFVLIERLSIRRRGKCRDSDRLRVAAGLFGELPQLRDLPWKVGAGSGIGHPAVAVANHSLHPARTMAA